MHMQMNPQQQLVDFISKINDVELDAEVFPLSKLAEHCSRGYTFTEYFV